MSNFLLALLLKIVSGGWVNNDRTNAEVWAQFCMMDINLDKLTFMIFLFCFRSLIYISMFIFELRTPWQNSSSVKNPFFSRSTLFIQLRAWEEGLKDQLESNSNSHWQFQIWGKALDYLFLPPEIKFKKYIIKYFSPSCPIFHLRLNPDDETSCSSRVLQKHKIKLKLKNTHGAMSNVPQKILYF